MFAPEDAQESQIMEAHVAVVGGGKAALWATHSPEVVLCGQCPQPAQKPSI